MAEDNTAVLTPVMQQHARIKAEHPDDILFFRLGDFYEMFNGDAVVVSKLLNLTLTHRGTAPMCGIPYHAAKVYIARLLRLGKKIAICEQIGDPKAKGLTERKVVEIITPGTVLESEYLEGCTHNYLAAFCVTHGAAGFAFIDVTTSDFQATSWRASDMQDNFAKELGRCSPRELLLPQSLRSNPVIQDALASLSGMSVSYYPDWDFNAESAYTKLNRQFKTVSLRAFGLGKTSPEVPAAGFLLDYLSKTANTAIPHVAGIKIYKDSQFLIIDESSRRNLELVSNLRDGTSQYTLLECVSRAMTSMGSRMIRDWILYPLTDEAMINARQSHVALFTENRTLLETVRQGLSPVLDVERLSSRIATDKAHAKDLQALKTSLTAWLSVRASLSEYDFALIDDECAVEIIDLIQNAIDDDPSTSLSDGGIIKAGYSAELDHWRDVRDNFDRIMGEYEISERERTGIAPLKIKYTNASGYFIEVPRSRVSSVPDDFVRSRTLLTGDRYTTPRLKELEHELSEAGARILELERDLFLEVRRTLQKYIPYLMQTAGEIAYADAAVSFAKTAVLRDWSRPSITSGGGFKIESGRHPVVENHIPSGEFIPNDLEIGAGEGDFPSFALITGPNMAGKSTFLRQNALIALLAQIGSFVPAKNAEIGIVDRIFCRVGASDNLARGESTFLVEMTETANILRAATERSLVIMDEVGRGTSTEDGLSIAQAVSEYLLNEIKCRTLFATHYHELTRLSHPELKLLCMDVAESGGTVTFLRKVKEGASENSYGIHVARLAGVPQSVIDRAGAILEHIQKLAEDRPVLDTLPECKAESAVEKPVLTAPGLFSDEEIILDEILSADPDAMTPLAALQAVARWKKALSGRGN